MRKLALALGVSTAVLFAGGVAWKADASTWRSGDPSRPRDTMRGRPPGGLVLSLGIGEKMERTTFGLASAPGISITYGLRFAANQRDSHDRRR
jgi:hypothetical protein